MNKLLLLCSVLGLVACGGSTLPDGGTPSDAGAVDAGTTTLSLAGARTVMFVGAAPVANWNVAPNRGEVSLVASSATEDTSFSFFFDGPPTVTTYVGNDAGVECGITVSLPSPSLDGWMANRGRGLPDLGTCSVTLSSVADKADLGTQKKYTIHGTVGGTLPARSGAATGTVTFSASF